MVKYLYVHILIWLKYNRVGPVLVLIKGFKFRKFIMISKCHCKHSSQLQNNNLAIYLVFGGIKTLSYNINGSILDTAIICRSVRHFSM